MNHIDISSEFCDASGELIPLKELLGPLVLPTLDTRGVSKPLQSFHSARIRPLLGPSPCLGLQRCV